jgi:hypothetical protein
MSAEVKEEEMTLYEVFTTMTSGDTAGVVLIVFVIVLSLIQVSPLKLNPWDRIFTWFGKKMNGETDKKLKELEKQVMDIWINNHRQSILTFARECRSDISHSSDEWSNVLNIAEEYEHYVKEKNVTNGIIHQDTEYLRNLYQQLSREHRI